jgi:CheY-like chemotaxis protein/chemotaxis signal transduction protein
MDVVRKNIVDELKGSIQISTKENGGTTFNIKLPLTMAMTRLFLISIADKVVAVPSNYVTEVLSVGWKELITVLDRKALRLRRQIIPVEHLSLLLGLSDHNSAEKDSLLIVILKFGNDELGLIVDSFLNEEELMIKPLPRHLKNLPLISGVSIGGNNEIINVLHVPKLVKAAKQVRTKSISRETVPGVKTAISILVVDDSLNTREIEKSILEAYGYEVELANDGAEALEKAHKRVYDVVITDVEMPRLDGFSLTEQLKAYEPYKEIPIIIVTSREKEEDKKRGIYVGANAYIVKGSFDQTNLVETVQNLVG